MTEAVATEEAPGTTATGAPAAGRRKMKKVNKILLIIFSLMMMGFLRTGFMFVIIGLLPSIVAYYMDVTANRSSFKTIFACNLSGMLPYLSKMIQHGPSSATLQSVMGDPNSWIIIYGAAMMGVILVKVCPMIAQFMIVGISHTQIGHIEHMQKKIETEWGNEVTTFSKAAQADEEVVEDDY